MDFGDDNLTYPILEQGGIGIISVASHLVGKELNQMVALALAGKKREAQAIHDRLMPLFEGIFVSSYPIPVKAALAMIGWPVGGLRLPLIEANEEEKAVVRKVLEKEMKLLSKQQKYEEAKIIRNKIQTLDYITQKRIGEEKFIENPNLIEDIRDKELESLKKLIVANGYEINNLSRIECFDIAHISGAAPTASMVVLINGEKENSQYRHFKIKQKKSQIVVSCFGIRYSGLDI